MNRNTIIGVLLVVVGVLLLAGAGGQETLALGPIRLTVEDRDDARLRQLAGVASLAGGIVVLVWGAGGGRRRRR